MVTHENVKTSKFFIVAFKLHGCVFLGWLFAENKLWWGKISFVNRVSIPSIPTLPETETDRDFSIIPVIWNACILRRLSCHVSAFAERWVN